MSTIYNFAINLYSKFCSNFFNCTINFITVTFLEYRLLFIIMFNKTTNTRLTNPKNCSISIYTDIKQSFKCSKSKFIFIKYRTFFNSIKNMSCCMRTCYSNIITFNIFIIFTITNSIMNYYTVLCNIKCFFSNIHIYIFTISNIDRNS